MLRYVLVFLAVVLLDFVWARYTITLAARKNEALIWAPAIYALGSYVIIQYTDDHFMLIPAVFGAVAGTWLGMKFMPEKKIG